MGIPELPKAQPNSPDSPEPRETTDTDSAANAGDGGTEATFERLIEQRIESHTAELERELHEIQDQLDKIDKFARISLNERKLKQSEANLSEFSDSLSSFAEKSFNHINALEDQLDQQALLMAAMLEALDDADIDVDLEEVRQQRSDSLVMNQTPRERLAGAIEDF